MGIWIVLCYLILGSLFMGLMLLFSPSDGLQFFAQHMGRRDREKRAIWLEKREKEKKTKHKKERRVYSSMERRREPLGATDLTTHRQWVPWL